MLFEEKSTKLVKWSKITTQQLKTVENPNIVDIKLVVIEHPKTLHKLPKEIWQAGKVSQVNGAGKNFGSPLYSETKKVKNFWWKKCNNNETISCW